MGGLISAVGEGVAGEFSARAQHDDNAAQAAAADRNERLKAIEAREQGAFQAGRIRMLGGQAAGAQRVGYAASGVDPTTGTAADVQADTRALAELDAQQTANNAARAAWGFEENRKTIRKQFEAKRDQIETGRIASIVGSVAHYTDAMMKLGAGGFGG